jgi:hypothetical protein
MAIMGFKFASAASIRNRARRYVVGLADVEVIKAIDAFQKLEHPQVVIRLLERVGNEHPNGIAFGHDGLR